MKVTAETFSLEMPLSLRYPAGLWRGERPGDGFAFKFLRAWAMMGCLAASCCAGLLQGCSSQARKELPVPIQYIIVAAEDVNPSISKRPSPVVVRLYELRNSSRFLSTDYFSLVQDDHAALAEELVSRQEYVLKPGETRLIRKNADLTTRFIGVVAGYRDIENSVWRSMVQIPAPHHSGVLWSGAESPERRLSVTVDRRAVQLVDELAAGERESQ